MDLLKSVVAFGVGIILTFLIVNRFDEGRLEKRFQSQLAHNLKVQASDSFRQATLEYHDTAQDAYLEMARIASSGGLERVGSQIQYDRERTVPIRRYEDDAWVKFRVSLEGIRLRFPANEEIARCLEQLSESNNKRHGLYQEAWIGWVSTSTPGERWNAGARNRPKYDEFPVRFPAHTLYMYPVSRTFLSNTRVGDHRQFFVTNSRLPRGSQPLSDER